jgi:hypothetical protein
VEIAAMVTDPLTRECLDRWAANEEHPCTASVIGEHVCRRTSQWHRTHQCVCRAVLLPAEKTMAING